MTQGAPDRRRGHGSGRWLLLICACLLTPLSTPPGWADATGEPSEAAVVAEDIAERWGVEVVAIRRSAADSMLDFRFRILDPEKARPLVDRRFDPMLIHGETGKRLDVPVPAKIGPLRSTEKFGLPKEGRIYFVLFGNAGRLVKEGDAVTVTIGDFRAENLVVE